MLKEPPEGEGRLASEACVLYGIVRLASWINKVNKELFEGYGALRHGQ